MNLTINSKSMIFFFFLTVRFLRAENTPGNKVKYLKWEKRLDF